MYLSQHSNTLSSPGEKPVRIVTQVRDATYVNRVGDHYKTSKGVEIVKEITIHVDELPLFDTPYYREMNRGLFEKA